MFEDSQDAIAWPSYVDFLSTFIFVLIIFLGSLLYLMAQGLRQGQFEHDSARSLPSLLKGGFTATKGRLQITVSLRGKLQFEKGCPDPLKSCAADMTDTEKLGLRNLARIIGDEHQRCTRIVVRGQASSDKYKNPLTGEVDKFGNFDLSNRRASMVLKYLLVCDECSAQFKAISSKLTLASVGDTLAAKNSPAREEDRTVDIVIDYAGGTQ